MKGGGALLGKRQIEGKWFYIKYVYGLLERTAWSLLRLVDQTSCNRLYTQLAFRMAARKKFLILLNRE